MKFSLVETPRSGKYWDFDIYEPTSLVRVSLVRKKNYMHLCPGHFQTPKENERKICIMLIKI